MLKKVRFSFVIFLLLINYIFPSLTEDLSLLNNLSLNLSYLDVISKSYLKLKIEDKDIKNNLNNILSDDSNFNFLNRLTEKDKSEIIKDLESKSIKVESSKINQDIIDSFKKIDKIYSEIINKIKKVKDELGESLKDIRDKEKFTANIDNINLNVSSQDFNNINLAKLTNLDPLIKHELENILSNKLDIVKIQKIMENILSKLKEELSQKSIKDFLSRDLNIIFLKRSKEYQEMVALNFIKKLNDSLKIDYNVGSESIKEINFEKELEDYAISDYNSRNEFIYNTKLNLILKNKAIKNKDKEIIKNIRDLYIKNFYKLAYLYKDNNYIKNSDKLLVLDNLNDGQKEQLKSAFKQEKIAQSYLLDSIKKNYDLITEKIKNSSLSNEKLKNKLLNSLMVKYNNILKSYDLKIRESNFQSLIEPLNKESSQESFAKKLKERRKSMNLEEEEQEQEQEEQEEEEFKKEPEYNRSLINIMEPLAEKMESMKKQEEEPEEDNSEWE